MGFIGEFKEFAVKGNVIDMAVGIIIGAAFGSIVNSLVKDVIMPPIGMLMGGINFADMFVALDGKAYATLSEAQAAAAPTINYGLFINSIISFIIVALAIFVLIKQINAMKKQPAPADPNTKECPYCKESIPKAAVKCSHCTSDLNGWGRPLLLFCCQDEAIRMTEDDIDSIGNNNHQSEGDQQSQSIPVRTTRHCSECGREINLKAEICPHCGVRVSPLPGTTRGGRTKIAAALLALFLGVAGAHKFYLGNAKMGIIYILISLTAVGLIVTMILGIYDFILLLTMSDADFTMKYE